MSENEDAAQAEAWKRKYYDALGQHEAQERQWGQAEELLRMTLSRLTLAADGLDDTLDRQLKSLRDAIRDHADSRVLRQRIETMSETLVRLDATRHAKPAAQGPAAPLQTLLDSLQLPRGHARRVKALRKQLDAAQTPEEIAALTAEFAALLHEVLAETGPGGTDKPVTGGLLGRLFGQTTAAPAPQSAEPEPAAPVRPASASIVPPVTDPQAAVRELLLHLIDRLPDPVLPQGADLRAQVQKAASEFELKRLAETLAETFRIPLPALAETDTGGELLLQLLERLDLPAELEPRIDAIKARLEGRVGYDAQGALRDIATLIADMRTRLQSEKREIETFLKQLTDRLTDIDGYVRGTESARAEAYQIGRTLDDAVQEQVRGIEDSVRAADSLDTLKQAVQQRVDAIIAHVDQHRRGEDAQQTAIAHQVTQLTERLHDMEAESLQLRERIIAEHRQALTDALTGIPNRLAYQERIAQEYARWKRFDAPLSLLIWDVDHFKAINDRYGHKAGDKVLKVIAGVLADNLRETDFLARYGGEEFVVVLPGTARVYLLDVAENLRHAVERCGFHYHGESVPITLSCGIAEFIGGDTVDEVFERADRALYRAKGLGRNNCVLAEA
ncbi:MAG: diguanylate cyclase [Gammaproteobacteria bacterium]